VISSRSKGYGAQLSSDNPKPHFTQSFLSLFNMSLLSAIILPLLVVQIVAAPPPPIAHPGTSILPRVSKSTEASTTGPGYTLDGNNITSQILPRDLRTFSICGADINAPPYNPWSDGEQNYFPYFFYSYRFQDQQGTRTWEWHLYAGPTGLVNHQYSSEHIYELQLITWFFDDYLVKRPEVIEASEKPDFEKRRQWLCRFHVKPKIINSKDWTTAATFDGFRTPATKLSAQLSGEPRRTEMVYLAADLNSIKGIFFGLKVPRDHNHLKDILSDLAKVSLVAQYLNHETVWKIFGHVSARMDDFYGYDVQKAVANSQWTLGRKVPWGGCYEDFESRFLWAIQRNMRKYRDNQIQRAKKEIAKREATTSSSMKWLRDTIGRYQEQGGPLSDQVFSLEKFRTARGRI
jgi:hypothetical protein